jgi:hypothetical protein
MTKPLRLGVAYDFRNAPESGLGHPTKALCSTRYPSGSGGEDEGGAWRTRASM